MVTLTTGDGDLLAELGGELAMELMAGNDRAPEVVLWGQRFFVRTSEPMVYREADGVFVVGLG